MDEVTGFTIFGVVAIIAATVAAVWITTMVSTTASANWQVCIEAGRQMVNGVCL